MIHNMEPHRDAAALILAVLTENEDHAARLAASIEPGDYGDVLLATAMQAASTLTAWFRIIGGEDKDAVRHQRQLIFDLAEEVK